MVANDPLNLNIGISTSLINLNVNLWTYNVQLHEIFMNVQNINSKIRGISVSFETFPKHKGASSFSETFSLNLYISASLRNV